MASISPNVLNCANSPHVSGKTDNHCRLTVTEITQDTNANTTRVKGKVTVEGTPYTYLYALMVQLGGRTLYDHHTGGVILNSWSAGQTIFEFDETFNNNADGTLTLYAYIKQMFYYGNGDTSRWTNPKFYQEGSANMVCSTIPRASSITSSADFTKGDAVTVTISRASSNFTHTVQFLVGGTVIKEIGGVATSTTWTPTKSEVESMLSKNTSSKIRIYTYNGSNHIGTTTKDGTAANPVSSTISNDFSFIIESSTKFNISRNKNYYTHSLEISVLDKLIKTITDVSTEASWTPNSTELNAIYDVMKNTPETDISVKCITYSRGAQVGTNTKNCRITISSEKNIPTFSGWSYKNNNDISNNVLGTDQVVLQSYNSIIITCNEATAKNKATISKYQAIVNGAVYETTDITNRKITIPNLNLSGLILFQVRTVDSRGFMATVEKTISFIDYSIPTLPTILLKRKNNYNEEVRMSLSGNISLIKYNNTSKNSVKEFKYRYKNSEGGSYSSWVDIKSSTIPDTASNYYFNPSNGNLSLDEVVIGNFPTDSTFQFEFIITDKVTSKPFTSILTNGIPLAALRKRKLGINCIPDKNGKDGLYINGIFIPYEESIYDNDTGTNGTVSFSKTIDNCSYIIIEFLVGNLMNSVRIDNPKSKKVSLLVLDSSTGTLYSKNITINDKSITVDSYRKVVLNSSSTSSNDIKIIKVIKGI